MPTSDEPKDNRVYVTLRVYHDDLDADHVGRLLGLEPTLLHRRGHPIREGGRRIAQTSKWFFTSKGCVASKDFEDHIEWLLDRLVGKDEAVRRLRGEGYTLEVSCYWLHAELGSILTLRPPVMKRLVELDLSIWIDAY